MFDFYHCIRKTRINRAYTCKIYKDPLEIPNLRITPSGIMIHDEILYDSVIIPIYSFIPNWYRHRYISKEIKNMIQIELE